VTRYQAIWPDGYRVVWRNLTWAEYRGFPLASRLKNPMDLYMGIYRVCRIEGPLPEVVPAGIVDWIGRQQTQGNPFSGQYADISRSLELARGIVQGNYLLSAKALIAAAFHYKPEEIDAWDADTFFVRLSQAELVLGRQLNPADPNAKAKPKTKLSGRELARKRMREREQPTVEQENVVVTSRPAVSNRR
jgi:hypothetical protein